ncbi:MAG: hypothetical protein ACYCXZ_03175 [Coriobacteriia bacterium]
MRGYIGNTDYDGYRFLSGQQGVDEVNFWQLSGGLGFHVIRHGEPFFFRLKEPYGFNFGGIAQRRTSLTSNVTNSACD